MKASKQADYYICVKEAQYELVQESSEDWLCIFKIMQKSPKTGDPNLDHCNRTNSSLKGFRKEGKRQEQDKGV
jgi:hypothetical protein